MTTQTSQIILAAQTPQQHHDWIAAFAAALIAVGVQQATDTGQVDLSTGSVDLPPSSAGNASSYFSTTPVFQVFMLVAAGKPTLYLRFDYGIFGNNNGNQPQALYSYPNIRLTVGMGTDGAGNLQSVQSSGSQAAFASRGGGATNSYAGSSSPGSGQPSLAAQACDFASDGQNYLTIMMGENAPSYENFSVFNVGVERMLNPADGTPNAAGAVVFCGHTGGDTWWFCDFANKREWTLGGPLPSIAPPMNIASSGDQVFLFPYVASTIAPQGAPLIGLSYYSASISAAVAFPATLYSTAHTYKACPRSVTSADPFNTGTKLALRFE
jgi:hypothetical protein